MQRTPFENRIKELCEEFLDCESDERQIELARKIRILIHDHVQELRGTLIPFPIVEALIEKRRA